MQNERPKFGSSKNITKTIAIVDRDISENRTSAEVSITFSFANSRDVPV
jgi:hypothetical protein